MDNDNRQYLGDGVYVSFDGSMIRLTTEYGMGATNEIFLEPEVWQSLVRYGAKFIKMPDGAGGP